MNRRAKRKAWIEQVSKLSKAIGINPNESHSLAARLKRQDRKIEMRKGK
jgi:hypothetical protein